MSPEVVIGVDIGTFETKGVAVDAAGAVLASATREHQMSVPRPGWAEHDAETVWWDGLVTIVRNLLDDDAVDATAVAALGVSGIGPCVLPIDAAGDPLRPAILYGVDTRATRQIEQIESRIGSDALVARTGNGLSSQSAGPKITWIRDNEPDVHAAAHRFVTSQSFIVGRLTGRWVIDHGTAGYYHPLYDLASASWYEPWCEDLVRFDQLPELAWANDIAGTVTAEAARATGLAPGTAVLVGCTDAPAEAVSAGVTRPGRMMVMYGSTHYMIEMLDSPVHTDVLWSAPYVFPGSYVLAGGTATAGTLTRWFRDLVTIDEQTPASFGDLAAEAAGSPPGAHGLLALPYFSGERTPINDPDARGVLIGLDLTHTRADVYRAILEGIARGVGANLESFAAHDAAPTELRAVGGGTRNAAWLQTVSDSTGRDQIVAAGTGASYGDAAIAAVAVGMLDDIAAIDRWVTVERTVTADDALIDLYRHQHRLATRLYDTTRPLLIDLSGGFN